MNDRLNEATGQGDAPVVRPTIKQATAECRSIGMTLRKVDDEFIVNFRNGKEATAYYTNDIEDAVATARAMISAAVQPGTGGLLVKAGSIL
jgi:hypothetical protein